MVRLGEDRAAFGDGVAVEAHDDRLGGRLAQRVEGGDDSLRDLVAGRDSAENVDEHRTHVRVPQNDGEAVGHDVRVGPASDVEEVGRPHPVFLSGVGDDV